MALTALTDTSAVTFNAINDTIYSAVSAGEVRLRATLNNLQRDADGNVSQADMLRMQQDISKWTMMIEIQSTITKQVSDSIKGVIQKSS